MRDYKQMKEIQELRKLQEERPDAEAAVPEQTDDAENARYTHRGPGFRGWVSYIWEYYKWPILIVGIIVIGVLIGIRQAAGSANPDLAITYVGPFYLSADNQEELKNDFAALSGDVKGDYNGDGEYRLSLLDLTITYVLDADAKVHVYDEQNSVFTRFQTELRAGDTMLYFLDKRYYLEAKNEGILQPLKDVLTESETKLSFDGYGIYIGDLNAYDRAGISRMPAGTVLCLRRSPDRDALKYGRTIENWESHVKLLRSLVRGTEPAEENPSGPDVALLYVSAEPCYRSVRFGICAQVGNLFAYSETDIKASFDVFGIDKSGSDARKAVQAKRARTELIAGNSFLWLLDEESFLYAKERGLLEPLPGDLSEGKAAVDGCGLLLSELPLFRREGFRDLRADSILCLRRNPESETESYGRTEERFLTAKEVFRLFADASETDE